MFYLEMLLTIAFVINYIPVVISSIYTVFYFKWLYRKKYRPHYEIAYQPSCAVMIPCKGIMQNMEFNLGKFLHQDYPHYEIIFIVESVEDPAYPVIKKLIQAYPHAKLIVAGYAKTCGQKNWNLLAGIKQAANATIYVFADGDVAPEKNWLQALILPLSNSAVGATTGFQLLVLNKLNLASLLHFYTAALMLFMLLGFNKISAYLWGGSMAIRKEDFINLKVADIWEKTVADDVPLSQLLYRHGKKCVFVPDCLMRSQAPISQYGDFAKWLKRQILFIKYYYRNQWLFVGIIASTLHFASILISIALFITGIDSLPFYTLLLIWLCTDFILVVSMKILNLTRYPLQIFLHSTWFQFFYTYNEWRTLFCDHIHWSNIRYLMNMQGEVLEVER